ncbi:MAG TPA: hypothetical protein VMW16_00825 [Sedimentisphaerales bacterium]|nr:hypothetical protein [Sedimentisphaerales bacterium]
MKSEEIYHAWKEQKSRVEVGADFCDSVMDQIYRYEGGKKMSLFKSYRLIEVVSAYPVAKAAVIAAGALIGLGRVAFMVHILLFT